MTAQASRIPGSPRLVEGWPTRLLRALVDAHRQAFISRRGLDARLIADIHAPHPVPTPDELRDAWRLWFGGDVMRKL